MTRLLVNDMMSALPDHKTFWHDLQDWFNMEFHGGDYPDLIDRSDSKGGFPVSLIIRNASWFGPLDRSKDVPTISLLQDIFDDGPQREMQKKVMFSSRVVVFNSEFTGSKYKVTAPEMEAGGIIDKTLVIPLPVDFKLFEPGNAMGLQQAHSLPDNCVLWIGASQGAAGQIKGFDIFQSIVRQNPDINFVAVFKDAAPGYGPTNLRMYEKLNHEQLVELIGACRVGLCTSRTESQHLAGIEMGACGLPMVARDVGTYWKRDDIPGVVLTGAYNHISDYVTAIRAVLSSPGDPDQTRWYWQKQFDKPFIEAAWRKLVEEVECSGQS